jgi:hypothetical protein
MVQTQYLYYLVVVIVGCVVPDTLTPLYLDSGHRRNLFVFLWCVAGTPTPLEIKGDLILLLCIMVWAHPHASRSWQGAVNIFLRFDHGGLWAHPYAATCILFNALG